MEGVLSEGDSVKVKLIGLDQKTGKFKLSRKVLMPKPEGGGGGGERPREGGRPGDDRPREGHPAGQEQDRS